MPLDASLSAWIVESRIAQGLPPVLDDPATIDRAADVFRIVMRSEQPNTKQRARPRAA